MLHADNGPGASSARPRSARSRTRLDPTLYERIAERILASIRDGTLVAGQRIPSVRRASEQFGVSVTTVLEAYRRLEDRGVIEARPQSGYYVRRAPDPPPAPARTATNERAAELTISDLVLRVITGLARARPGRQPRHRAPSSNRHPADPARSPARARHPPALAVVPLLRLARRPRVAARPDRAPRAPTWV